MVVFAFRSFFILYTLGFSLMLSDVSIQSLHVAALGLVFLRFEQLSLFVFQSL